MTASAARSSQTVGQLVAERPERGRLFERLGIDYCCGGRKPLAEACMMQGLDLDQVCTQLDAVDAEPAASTEPDWTTEPLTRLVDNIESVHHDTLRTELPRLAALVQKVVSAHGRSQPALAILQHTLSTFSRDLFSHMSKEETVLFPWIRSLEAGAAQDQSARHPLDQPIEQMMAEHDDAGRALATMRELTNDFAPPPDACGTYRVMLAGLRGLEADMHIHVHKENNILFPRALALDSSHLATCYQSRSSRLL